LNSYLEAFIRNAKVIAAQHKIEWNVPLDDEGVAEHGHGWNLTMIVGASPPPLTWFNDFGTDRKSVDFLNSSPPPGPVREYKKQALGQNWEDLVKACAIDQLLIRRTTPGHVACNVVRPLRVLATCCAANSEPWLINVDDVKFAIKTARQIQPSGKLADLIFGVIRSILDPNHLTDAGPLSPALERDNKGHERTARFAKSKGNLRSQLEERKHAEKLPERRAFWELTRIAFTETPRSFLDVLRFAQARTLILTGLRDGECAMLPADWKRYREYFDSKQRPAGEAGGVSRSLMLRHFAEKQRVAYEDSTALFETVQFVPIMFEETLTTTLDQVATMTEPLRNTLRDQVKTGCALPQFERSELVRAIELYTYLTGNPFFTPMADDDRRRYVSRYQREYDSSLFDELRRDQLEVLRFASKLDQTTYLFLNRFKGAPYRDARGIAWDGRKSWSDIYLRVGEVEDFLAAELPTKRSDTRPLKLAEGELGAWELLFLMPKRALGDVREDGLCDITRYCAIGRMDRQMITNALSSRNKQTLFASYGQTEEDRQLTLRPHSLRHLQNTELFRLGVADTIITRRFNRRSVAQSYEYDHRSLAEELEQIDLEPEVELQLRESSATVARLIKAGKARGPVIEAFKKIQQDQGEAAAIEYLAAEADGFHSTPYGHCVNSFLVDPCSKHLECFTGCRHLSATDLTETRKNLVQLEANLNTAVNVLEQRRQRVPGGPPALGAGSSAKDGAIEPAATRAIEKRLTSGIGVNNQLSHAKVRLDAVRKLLATPPGEQVFPAGPDLSVPSNKAIGRVLDDIL
jgi:hypothetical protein